MPWGSRTNKQLAQLGRGYCARGVAHWCSAPTIAWGGAMANSRNTSTMRGGEGGGGGRRGGGGKRGVVQRGAAGLRSSLLLETLKGTAPVGPVGITVLQSSVSCPPIAWPPTLRLTNHPAPLPSCPCRCMLCVPADHFQTIRNDPNSEDFERPPRPATPQRGPRSYWMPTYDAMRAHHKKFETYEGILK